MEVLLSFINSKLFLYLVIATGALGTMKMRSCQQKEFNAQLQTYERQLKGELTQKEIELQTLNQELGVAQSQLMTQKDLARQANNKKEELDLEFEAFKRRHNLEIRSRDRTIARLTQIIEGGTSSTDILTIAPDGKGCENIESLCVISYNWEDTLKRFRLKDPNIFNKDDEVFESSQLFKVYGEVFQQKDGSLQTRRVVLREVVKDESGKYLPIDGAKAEVVDSKFDYTNPPSIDVESSWLDLFQPKVVALGTATIMPESKLKFGLGVEFFNMDGLGINTHTAIDLDSISGWEHRLGVTYQPSIFDQDLNLAIGTSIGTPYSSLGSNWSFNIDLLFYLHN